MEPVSEVFFSTEFTQCFFPNKHELQSNISQCLQQKDLLDGRTDAQGSEGKQEKKRRMGKEVRMRGGGERTYARLLS